MNITDLPFDCLLKIFNSLDKLDDLINCFKAYNHWEEIIKHCTSKVNLLSNSSMQILPRCKLTQLSMDKTITDVTLSRFVPGLKILYINIDTLSNSEAKFLASNLSHIKLLLVSTTIIVSTLIKAESFFNAVLPLTKEISNMTINPIIHAWCRSHEDEGKIIPKLNLYLYDNLKIFCIDEFDIDPKKELIKCPTVKQLYLKRCNSEQLDYISKCFPNLHKIHIKALGALKHFPKFENLNVLIYAADDTLQPNNQPDEPEGILPNLESAFLLVITLREDFLFIMKKNTLKNLVIEFDSPSFPFWYWVNFQMHIRGAFNLENLAIRYFDSLDDEGVLKLIYYLSKLRLFEVTGCPNVTPKIKERVKKFTRMNNRRIQFIYNREPKKTSNRSPPDSMHCGDFNFMKNCFPRCFEMLPCLEDFDSIIN